MKEILSFLLPYVRKNWMLFASMAFFVALSAIAETYIPIQIGFIIDNFSQENQEEVLISGFITILILASIAGLGGIISRALNNRFSRKLQYDIREDIFETLQAQELNFYSSESIGQIMARTVEEVFAMRDILGWGIRISIYIMVLFISAFFEILLTSVYLALAYGLIVPLALLILGYLSKKKANVFYLTRFKYGEMNQAMAENYSGIKTVKSFGREDEHMKNFDKVNFSFYKTLLQEINIRSIMQPLMLLFINVGIVIILIFSASLLKLNLLSSGEFVSFILLTLNITTPGRFLGFIAISLQISDASAIRLNEVLKAGIDVRNSEHPTKFPEQEGDILFTGVSFRYPQGHVNALNNLNLKIKAGEKLAILGPTGAGKSTLINLLPRFYDVNTGEITIGGTNIKNIHLNSLRKHIGIIHQDNFLFTMSIEDNIRFGRKGASREEIVAAAKAAQIHEFISSLDEGYGTIIGERGVTLSGGQRQRVAIAREIITEPSIIVFDDSVSAVDPETESKLQDTLNKFSSGKTVIIISQRPSSLKYADRILVIDEGKVSQLGTHDKLKNIPGIYQRFIEAVDSQIQFIKWGDNKGSEAS